ncbi:phosphoribosyltransferase-like protein [Gorgonomyces haynaldii]|nr:phosphoribosyltransferase-like protein [Gorgonomyces haynaldii]
MRNIKIFTGSSHPELTALILERLGLQSSPAILKRFSNAETSVEIGISVRDSDVFIIQSGSSQVNDHVMELLIMVSACRAASARRITAVLPYYPYNKQSKKKKARGAITAKLLANMLVVAGVDHIITMDLHSTNIQGFFNKPCDNLMAEPVIARYISEHFPNYLDDGVVISKNAGGAKTVTSMADRLRIDFAMMHRERYHIKVDPDSPEEMLETRLTLVGEVKGKVCFMLDDSIDGSHSFLDSCVHLKKCEAAKVYIVATHGILSGHSLDEIEQCDAVDGVIVTNTYPIPIEKRNKSTKLQIIDISGVLAEAIRRTHNGESISYLFHTAI